MITLEKQVTLNVHMRAAVGRERDLADVLTALVEPTRAEEGCLGYELHRDPADGARFMFYENWVDQAALDAHLATPKLKDFLARTDELLAEPMVMTSWRKYV